MDALARLFLIFGFLSLTGCYTLKSAYHQMALLASRESYDQVLKRPDLTDEQRRKIALAQEARDFAESTLKLNSKGNFSKMVWLDRPYVVWSVNASDPWLLKPYEWSFPIVGRVPYLGFFNADEAHEKQKELMERGLDTHVRGVSAYSTLGWFSDPLLSSMLNYDDDELIETVIHELVHSTIWIKDSVDFNERLASFLGRKGAQAFFKAKEGPASVTSVKIEREAHDDALFSEFITQELKDLETWYTNLKPEEKTEERKAERLKKIQQNFAQQLKPKLKSNSWNFFETAKLNNARLVLYRTYLQDFAGFEKLWQKLAGDFPTFVDQWRKLVKSKNPDADLKLLIETPE